MDKEMTLTTLENLPGMDIEEHIGLVSGNAVFSQSSLRAFVTNLKSFMGGELRNYDEQIQQARNDAMKMMLDQAKNLGANAVIGIRFENSHTDLSFTEVYVYGTAVKASKY